MAFTTPTSDIGVFATPVEDTEGFVTPVEDVAAPVEEGFLDTGKTEVAGVPLDFGGAIRMMEVAPEFATRMSRGDDLADAAMHFMNTYNEAGHVNVGTSRDVTIKELAESIAKVVGYTGKIGWDTTKPNGNPRKLLDSSKAKMLGWEPKTPFEVGLTKTYHWYLENV